MKLKRYLLTSVLNFLVLIGIAHAQVNFTKMIVDSTFAENSWPSDVAAADLNGDDEIDLVLTAPDLNGNNDILAWYQNDGSENFTKLALDTTVVDPFRISLVDLDHDLDNDIVIASAFDGLLLYTNDGSANFTRSAIEPGYVVIRVLHVIDLDDDTDDDIVVLSNDGVFWEVNDGSQSFVRDTVEAIPIVDGGLFSTDLDGDADIDLVSAVFGDSGGHILVWYQNDGSQNFSKDTVDVQQQTITDIFVDDLDEDGDKDILTLGAENNSVLWYRNDGIQNFTRDTIGIDFNQSPVSMAVADIDNDDDKDVIVTGGNHTIGEVVYYENDGNENFTKRIIDNTEGNRNHFSVIDVDQDGDLDLLVTNNFPFQVIFYRNDGVATDVADELDFPVPKEVTLAQNYPNPFNPGTTIQFSLLSPGYVSLKIYNMLGEEVTTLVAEPLDSGIHKVDWDASGLASGIYLYRLQTGDFVATRKLLLLR